VCPFGITHWWLAGTDEATEGTWIWDDGHSTSFSYTDWDSGYPTTNTSLNCLEEYYASGTSEWRDAACTANLHYVCALR